MSNKSSVKESLKNTGLVGGSRVLTIIISIIKTKFVAILLGPAGIGMVQLFTSSISLVQSISGLGIGFSGIRDIAQSHAKGDIERTSKTVITLKRWSLITGVIGIIFTIVLSKKLSFWTFGSEDYWKEIALLSITILLANMAASYAAVIRGARRIKDFSKISIYSAILSSILAIAVYFFYGVDGIVPVLIITGIITLLINMFFANKIHFQKVKFSYRESFFSGLDMVKLGFFTVVASFIAQAALYYVRISIKSNLGLEYVGFYASATVLAVTYMGIIFTAMAADYYPKLSAINKDNKAINIAILEQTKILLLLGTPLIVLMYTFSEYIIQILYTKAFVLALPLLMWMLCSVFLRFIGFPIGYVFLAKGKGNMFILIEILRNLIFVVLTILSWQFRADLAGIGIAFTLAYIISIFVNFIIIKNLTSLKYDFETIQYIIVYSLVVIFFFMISYLPKQNGYILLLKIIFLIILCVYNYRKTEKLTGINLWSLIKNKIVKKK